MDSGAVISEAIIVSSAASMCAAFDGPKPPNQNFGQMQWHVITMLPCHCSEPFHEGLNTISTIEYAMGKIGSVLGTFQS